MTNNKKQYAEISLQVMDLSPDEIVIASNYENEKSNNIDTEEMPVQF